MKINIFFKEVPGAWGGGNQFLKALKCYLVSIDSYVYDFKDADVIIFNSHQFLNEILKIKLKYPEKIFIHRIDGPMVYYRDGGPYLDLLLFKVNEKLSDGTIFQSSYSKVACKNLGLKNNFFEQIITNAPNPRIFNQKNKTLFSSDRRVRLISTSWSPNWRKGFDVYQWLDINLDFTKYEMTFIGNSPIKFKNIKMIEPLDSRSLAHKLKESDIFIFASKIESCSNSLLEALHSGLPAIAYDSTGNTEILKKFGKTFQSKNEIPHILDDIVENYAHYAGNIDPPKINDIGNLYFIFCKKIYNDPRYKTKKISYYFYHSMKINFLFKKAIDKFIFLVRQSLNKFL